MIFSISYLCRQSSPMIPSFKWVQAANLSSLGVLLAILTVLAVKMPKNNHTVCVSDVRALILLAHNVDQI